MSKKVLIVLIALMTIGLTACAGMGGSQASSQPNTSNSSVSVEENSSESDSIIEEPSSEVEESKPEGKPDQEEYLVTFHSDGGSLVESVKVKKGDKVPQPETPKKSSGEAEYEFVAWLYNGQAWDFDTNVVMENITLMAQWKVVGNYSQPFLPKD